MKFSIVAITISFNLFEISFCAQMETFKLDSKKYFNLAESVSLIINEIFVEEITTTNIITSVKHKNYPADDFLGKLLSRPEKNCRVCLLKSKEIAVVFGRRKHSSIFLVTDFSEFKEIYRKITPEVFRLNGHYVIVLLKGEIDEIDEIFQLLWKILIYNVVVMFEESSEKILVKTFVPFHENNCSDTSSILVNTFEAGRFKNGISNLFVSKMYNLHNCTIRVSISNNSKPYIFAESSPDGRIILGGEEINLLNMLAKHLNFKINYTYIGLQGYFYDNGSAQGNLRSLLDKKSDLSLSNFWIKLPRFKFFDCTTSYMSEKIIFAVPPGREYSAFENLVFPFDFNLWILIIGCFSIASIVIFIIKFFNKSVQRFVFGTGVDRPGLNLIIGFFGGIQTILPKRNFARFLLAVFLLYSLIIRTLYQGSYYQFLKSGHHHKRVQFLDEMIQNDFKFYAEETLAPWLSFPEMLKRRVVALKNEDVWKISAKINDDSSYKLALVMPLTKVLYANKFLKGQNKFKVAKEVFLTIPAVIYTHKDFYLLKALDKNIEILKTAGFIDYWHFKHLDEEVIRERNEKKPKKIKLYQLKGCFKILSIGSLISIVTFVMEIKNITIRKIFSKVLKT